MPAQPLRLFVTPTNGRWPAWCIIIACLCTHRRGRGTAVGHSVLLTSAHRFHLPFQHHFVAHMQDGECSCCIVVALSTLPLQSTGAQSKRSTGAGTTSTEVTREHKKNTMLATCAHTCAIVAIGVAVPSSVGRTRQGMLLRLLHVYNLQALLLASKFVDPPFTVASSPFCGSAFTLHCNCRRDTCMYILLQWQTLVPDEYIKSKGFLYKGKDSI